MTLLSAAFRDLPPAMGSFDEVTLTGSQLRVGGWMLHPGRRLTRMAAAWNGEIAGETSVRSRPDVQATFPDIARELESGFLALLPVADGGRGRVDVIGYCGEEPVARLSLRFFGAAEMRWPQPPAELTLRVSGSKGAAFRVRTLKTFTDLLDQAERHGGVREGARVLDWGCGCGAISSLLLRHHPGVRLEACDVDPRGVEWCRANLPQGRFLVVGARPPLPYEDASFDLVVASSVFTHLRLDDQRLWLAELRRVLRPGGLMLASTMGPRMLDEHLRFRGRRWRRLRKARFLLTGFDDFRVDHTLDGVATGLEYRCVYQTKPLVRRAWSRFLQVVEHVDNGLCGTQDLVVLRRA